MRNPFELKIQFVAILLIVVVTASFATGFVVGSASRPKATTTSTYLSTTTEIVVTTYTAPSAAILESGSLPGRSQVEVNQIWAVVVPSTSGGSIAEFYVNFENRGPSAIYFTDRFGGALSTSLALNSTALQESPLPPCLGGNFLVALQAGENYTIGGPGCAEGYNYQVFAQGLAVVHLSFGWTTNQNESPPYSNETWIQAQFKFV